MRVTAIESTTLATVAYNQTRKLLQLAFRSGAIYQYFGVLAAVHQALLQAPATGGYFTQALRSCFAYSRVGHLQAATPGAEVAAGRQR